MIKTNFDAINEQTNHQIDEEKLSNLADKIFCFLENEGILEQSCLKDYDLDKITLSGDILICDNKKIHEINKEYRHKDRPTDVITFALFADDENSSVVDEEIYLGEIIISADQTKIQADENKKTFDEELHFLISHGILHLLGFDHQDEETYNFMITLQDKILDNVKI